MTMITSWEKDPDARLDWIWDWSDWLDAGETITLSVFTVSAGLVLDTSTNSTTTATVWLTGGTAGQPYSVANRITTSVGRIDEKTITIRVTNR